MVEASIKDTLFYIAGLISSVTDCEQLEAQLLLAFVLQKPRAYLYAHPERMLKVNEIEHLMTLVERRLKHEPIAYIIGTKEFWGFNLEVSQDVLIPRPETEVLVDAAINLIPRKGKVLDLGTGSGAIAISLATCGKDINVYASDNSEQALKIAKKNALKLQLKNITFLLSHWFDDLKEYDFDMIVSNPPYLSEKDWQIYGEALKYEPQSALLSGDTGLDAIREIIELAPKYLKSGGFLMIEHGLNQADALYLLFEKAGFCHIRMLSDLQNLPRVTLGERP